ncbi:MAG TPA: alpha-glucosidase/alpha-galactosidase [Vicinamibacterales bacterium]|nr:alpha-glucosidase/alpha-galactosidase [Vicinamibacterales bacterium]
MAIKVAVIGAGSIGFTRLIVRDVLKVPELRDTVFSFTDINAKNLDAVAKLCRRDIARSKLAATVRATTDRRRALEGADYVLNFARVGGLEAFQLDIDTPLKYGVDQCVGDTLCAGGLMYAQRSIPALLEFCRDIREVAKPGALFLNYANPMAMNTWACDAYGGVRVIGLCHGVEGGHRMIAEALGLPVEEVDIICAGINHQSWYIQVRHKGRDVTGEILEAFERHPVYSKTEKVRIDLIRRFGYFTTESNGHVSEYLPWYRKRPDEIRKWIDLSDWIHGETGGYLRVCIEGRNWFETEVPKWLAEEPPKLDTITRSTEHASYIIESLETGRRYRGHFNVRNNGTIANLPADCIVEAPGYVDGNGVSVPRVGDLPLACAATCAASVNVQRMGMEAAVRGDAELLKLAMLHDPLVGAVCDPPEVWQMTDELLVAQAEWLPQYAGEVPKAKKRLASAKRLGTRTSKGAARLKVRTVAELSKDRAAAQRTIAADKAATASKAAKASTPAGRKPGRKRAKK